MVLIRVLLLNCGERAASVSVDIEPTNSDKRIFLHNDHSAISISLHLSKINSSLKLFQKMRDETKNAFRFSLDYSLRIEYNKTKRGDRFYDCNRNS